MKIYFYSPVKTLISTRGENFAIGKNIVQKNIPADEIIAVKPYGGQNCTFCLNHPQVNVNAALTIFYDGLLFIPVVKPVIPDEYKVIYEKTLNIFGSQYYFSVVSDKTVKLVVKGYRTQKEVICPFVPDETEITVLKNALAVQLKASVTKLVVFSLSSLEVLLDVSAKKVYLSDTIVIEKNFFGAFEYVYSVQYSLSPFSVIKKYLDKKGKARDNRLIAGLAFFETLNYGGDTDEFLSDDLTAKKDALKNFIPAWKYIIPPVKKDYPSTFCLLGKKPIYAKLTFENDKITDIDVNDTPQ